jgi:DNA-binding Xre family transcriptional regulator
MQNNKTYLICKRQRNNEESVLRKISYKKLWKLLIDKDMNKKTLSLAANISQSTLTKMSKGESVNIEMLARICNALDCEFYDIIEMVSNENGDV